MKRPLALVVALIASTGLAVAAREQSPPDPGAVLAQLKEGNARFVANPAAPAPVDAERRHALVAGQHPMAIVLSCADSRVPPEIVFNRGLGELFVIRVAGEVTDQAVLGSVEYAAEHLSTPLVVVMGHQSCGAVTAAMNTAPGTSAGSASLDYLVGSIRPAFERMTTPADAEHLREAILANVEEVVNSLLEKSPVIEHLHREGKLALVGAYYELESGRVHFSTPVVATATTHGGGR
ncbi:MAG: carbonic anhydrase [Vicinamibacterales bacterium]